MANVSTMTPANAISTSRTANPAAASSTASPTFNSNITTWTLPNFAAQPLVATTQSFSTLPGQIFSDFASGTIVPMPGVAPAGQSVQSLQSGSPEMD